MHSHCLLVSIDFRLYDKIEAKSNAYSHWTDFIPYEITNVSHETAVNLNPILSIIYSQSVKLNQHKIEK